MNHIKSFFYAIAFSQIVAAILDKSALALIALGAVLFAGHVPLSDNAFVNLPFLESAIQICGGMLILSGFALISSRLFWPETLTKGLLEQVENGNVAAAVVLSGLKIFNGLSIIGFAIWFAMAFNAGVSAR
jgi:hypothetical protein